MDENNKHGQGCMCGTCGGQNYKMRPGMCGYCGGGHMGLHILRWVLGLLIILMIFSFGMRVGEFKAELQGGNMMYGGGRMIWFNAEPMMYNAGTVQGTTGSSVMFQAATPR